MGDRGGVLGKDKWEWGMGRRGLCSANGSRAFPRSGRPRLLLTVVPLHCNYLQWRDSYWERGQQNSRQRGIKSKDWQDGGPLVKPFSAARGFSTECLYDPNHPMWVYSLLDYLVYENRKRVTCQGLLLKSPFLLALQPLQHFVISHDDTAPTCFTPPRE